MLRSIMVHRLRLTRLGQCTRWFRRNSRRAAPDLLVPNPKAVPRVRPGFDFQVNPPHIEVVLVESVPLRAKCQCRSFRGVSWYWQSSGRPCKPGRWPGPPLESTRIAATTSSSVRAGWSFPVASSWALWFSSLTASASVGALLFSSPKAGRAISARIRRHWHR